ncbi:MAG: lactonase family protein [Saprospiraceae bacterium]|nr:lactonase family protein [Saprospiraceae bacterium]
MPYILLLITLVCISCSQEKDYIQFAVGTYTQTEGHVNGKGEGIYMIELDDSLNIVDKKILTGATNPSYVAMHPNHTALYAVNETYSPQHQAGLVFSYLKNSDGIWQAQQMLSSMGAYPCHIIISESMNAVFVTNYGNNIAAYRIKADGKLDNAHAVFTLVAKDSLNWRQDSPHPHMSYPFQLSNELLVSDLGSNCIYHLEYSDGDFKEKAVYNFPTLAGPRHLVSTSDELNVFILNELDLSIHWMERDSTNGIFGLKQIHNLSDSINDFSKITASAIRLHSRLNTLYAATRALDGSENDKIHVIGFDIKGGEMLLKQSINSGGQIPRDFNIDPSGNYLAVANQDSDNIVIYPIDNKTGKLGEAVKELIIPSPAHIEFY